VKYLIKKIDFNAREKIFCDIFYDKGKVKDLCFGSGYFNENPGLKWAIDEKNNSYVFLAPNLNFGEDDSSYYYYYSGKMYHILRASSLKNTLYIEEKIDPNKLDLIKKEITQVFLVYGESGDGFPFEVEVKALK